MLSKRRPDKELRNGGVAMAQPNILYPSLDTPAVLVDLDRLEANINEAQSLADSIGVKLRPVSYTHLTLPTN